MGAMLGLKLRVWDQYRRPDCPFFRPLFYAHPRIDAADLMLEDVRQHRLVHGYLAHKKLHQSRTLQ